MTEGRRARRKIEHKAGNWIAPPNTSDKREGLREIRFRPYTARDAQAWDHACGIEQAMRVPRDRGRYEWVFIDPSTLYSNHAA